MRLAVMLALLASGITASAQQQSPNPSGRTTREALAEGKTAAVAPAAQEVPLREATRASAVKEMAMQLAMRTALAEETDRINNVLAGTARLLDEVYDFGSLMLQGNILPPVIQRADNVTETTEDDILQYTGRVFRIKQQPRFATRPPTWRSYLVQPAFTDIGKPHPALLPKNDAEREAWRQGVVAGWNAGAAQARAIFVRNVYRLQADFMGMMTYHWLLKANMVTAPIVSNQTKAVVGDASSISIDQVTYRIEAKPVFNANMSEWLPYLNAPDPAMAERHALEIAAIKPGDLQLTSSRPSREALLRVQFDSERP